MEKLIYLLMVLGLAYYVWVMWSKSEKQNKSSVKLDYVPYKIFYDNNGQPILYYFFELYDITLCKDEIKEEVLIYVDEIEYYYMKINDNFIKVLMENKEFWRNN